MRTRDIVVLNSFELESSRLTGVVSDMSLFANYNAVSQALLFLLSYCLVLHWIMCQKCYEITGSLVHERSASIV